MIHAQAESSGWWLSKEPHWWRMSFGFLASRSSGMLQQIGLPNCPGRTKLEADCYIGGILQGLRLNLLSLWWEAGPFHIQVVVLEGDQLIVVWAVTWGGEHFPTTWLDPVQRYTWSDFFLKKIHYVKMLRATNPIWPSFLASQTLPMLCSARMFLNTSSSNRWVFKCL